MQTASTQTTERFEIRNRWTNAPQFEAEITCAPDASISVKMGLAVGWAIKSRADLSRADLSRADLSRANLSGVNLSGVNLSRVNLSDADLSRANLSYADLSGADLSRVNLSGVDLSDADLSRANLSYADLSDADLSDEQLRPFKADLFLTLSMLAAGPLDAQHLIHKLRAGEVDGSTYGRPDTQCACLVGTLAQPRGVRGEALDHNSDRPAERWFMMIHPGDKPSKETGGGFAARMALEWTLDWCRCHGVDPDMAPAVEAAA